MNHRATVGRTGSDVLPWQWKVIRPTDGKVIAHGAEGSHTMAIGEAHRAVSAARLWWTYGRGKP